MRLPSRKMCNLLRYVYIVRKRIILIAIVGRWIWRKKYINKNRNDVVKMKRKAGKKISRTIQCNEKCGADEIEDGNNEK